MLQTFYELPHRTVERRGHAQFFAAVGGGAFLDRSASIAVVLDAKSLGDSFSFRDQSVEQRTCRSEARGCAVVEKSESANGICGSVEDEFGPLSTAGVLERNDLQTCAIQQFCEFCDAGIGSICWFEGTDPGVAVNVEANVAGRDYVAGGERGA